MLRNNRLAQGIEENATNSTVALATEAPLTLRRKILIVEDDAATREILRDLLSERNFKVTTASDGYEAVEMLEQESCDLIILDIRLPRLDGLEVARIAQSRPQLPKIIMMTAYPEWYFKEEARDIDAAAIFIKPFDLSSLTRTVEELFEGEQMEDSGGPR
jgi:two-component system response regulator (stage 0 sporulation protein F)